MYAVRTIRLCTKDCLCLYVCPTGATDTEDGQIDRKKCLDGCRLCVDACPSHAISLVPEIYPPQQEKTSDVTKALDHLSKSKAVQEQLALYLAQNADTLEQRQLAQAIATSNQVMGEDLLREAGYLLPQGQPTLDLLNWLLTDASDPNLPKATIQRLIDLLT